MYVHTHFPIDYSCLTLTLRATRLLSLSSCMNKENWGSRKSINSPDGLWERSQDLTQTVWQNRPSSHCTRPPTLSLDPQVHTLKIRNCFSALGQITSINKTKPGSLVSTNQVNLSSHNIVLKRFQGAHGIKNKQAKKKIKLVEKWLVARSWGVGKQGEVGKRVHLPAIRRIKSEALTYNVGVRVAIQHGIV